MDWRFWKKSKPEAGQPAPATKEPAAKEVPAAVLEAGVEEEKAKGMLPQFFRKWKDPAFLRQMKVVVARMQKEGVDVKDKAAVKTWLKTHEKDLDKPQEEASSPKVETYVRKGPDAGRNDPCPCGSGKKYKRCCLTKEK